MTDDALSQSLASCGAVVGDVAGQARMAHFGDAAQEYRALTEKVGLVPMSGRSQIEMTGADRATMLQGFCTNDIKSLAPGHGCEAFITSGQGKTLGYVNFFCGDDALLLDTSAG